MVFQNKGAAKITAELTGLKNKITVSGVTSDANLTLENSKTQIDKILTIINRSVKIDGMIRTLSQGGVA